MKQAVICFRVDKALKKKIEDLANRDGRTVSGQVSIILKRFFEKPSSAPRD